MAGEGGGREGDWECSSCRNRNYAFRSFCNRCKQPRLHVDTKTSADSKWLPRIGDWICSGCTNNNYASREKCKKCGQPKEVATMPAVADPTYFAARPDQMHPSLSLSSSRFSLDRYGSQSQPTVSVPYGVHHPASLWHLGINNNITGGLAFATQTNQIPPVANGNGWRAGDWMCKCGFHNYSSRVQCKKCDAPTPIVTPQSTAVAALGTKRMASEEISNWENKRLNAGQAYGVQQSYPAYDSFGVSQFNSIYPAITTGSADLPPNFQVNLQMLGPGTPVLLGKGAKQWRDGDWMCSNCNNHNYASRAQCNRCKSQRELAQPVSA